MKCENCSIELKLASVKDHTLTKCNSIKHSPLDQNSKPQCGIESEKNIHHRHTQEKFIPTIEPERATVAKAKEKDKDQSGLYAICCIGVLLLLLFSALRNDNRRNRRR